MLRRLTFLFTLLLCGLHVSASAGTPVNLTPLNSVNESVCAKQMTGTATYALSSALTGTTSGPVDLGLVGCFSFSVTSTGGTVVRVWQSSSSTTYTAGTSNTAGTIFAYALPGGPNGQACYSLQKAGGRYVWFDIPASQPNKNGAPFNTGPGYVTPTAITTSVWYYLPTNWPN
jgi:hypothetical protein